LLVGNPPRAVGAPGEDLVPRTAGQRSAPMRCWARRKRWRWPRTTATPGRSSAAVAVACACACGLAPVCPPETYQRCLGATRAAASPLGQPPDAGEW